MSSHLGLTKEESKRLLLLMEGDISDLEEPGSDSEDDEDEIAMILKEITTEKKQSRGDISDLEVPGSDSEDNEDEIAINFERNNDGKKTKPW
ncbi:hypothetical protein JTB14_020727 [Gonioctena quinquepunctata]|nr:hypothetical protein JTB14_020727 [Gonioctena quinquepunctata]